MNQPDLSNAPVLIFDPTRGNMLTTRTLLLGVGFRRIEGIHVLAQLERKLRDPEFSLLMIEAGDDIPKTVKQIRAIRHGELGANPFVPIIGTLWTGLGDAVTELMNAGCDDVLLRPFSAHKLMERIRWLLSNRQQFVVTSDYVGPDRGGLTESAFAVDPFDVPNPLRERVLDEAQDPVRQAEAINAARQRVDKERLAKLARRIAMAAEVTIQASANSTSSTGFVMDLIETAHELVKAAKRLPQDDVQDIAVVLESVATRTAAPGPERAENAQLTRQLALALYTAYAIDESEEFKNSLDSTLLLVRARLDRARERARKRMSLSSLLEAS